MEKSKKKDSEIVRLKKKELEVLVLLYRFRFLNRIQVQKILGHKHHGQIQLWLNSLLEKGLVAKDYEKEFGGKPAIYYLTPPCRKYLKDQPGVKLEQLDRRLWREKDRTEEFKEHCLFLANIYLSLLAFAEKHGSKLFYYAKTDLFGHEYIIDPKPDALFVLETKSGFIKRYYLDLFDEIPPRAMRARIDTYLEYYDDDTWSEEFPDRPFPTMIFICPHKRLKGHLYHYIQDRLDEYPEEVELRLATRDQIEREGITSQNLTKVERDE
jgi:DNA-binding PadR family transcriptional regulator